MVEWKDSATDEILGSPDKQDLEAQARSAFMFYHQQRVRMEKAAGRAQKAYNTVNQELTEAIDVFSSGDYGNLSLDELARAARKIASKASQLIAAGRLTEMRQAEDEAQREWIKLQEDD